MRGVAGHLRLTSGCASFVGADITAPCAPCGRPPPPTQVLSVAKDERGAMQDAVEMAVLSMVHHPNIVQLYSCLTDMVEVQGEAKPASATCALTLC
jgi:hypothetical protein